MANPKIILYFSHIEFYGSIHINCVLLRYQIMWFLSFESPQDVSGDVDDDVEEISTFLLPKTVLYYCC